MTTTEQEKLNSRLRCVLLELSIVREDLMRHDREVAASLIAGAGSMVEQAQAHVDHLNYRIDSYNKNREAQPTT